MIKYFYLIPFFILSCAHKNELELSKKSDFVFADGVYKQAIHVRYEKNNKAEENNFSGVLKKDKLNLNLYCYVGFGITLFKINDTEGKPLQFISEQDEVEKNKDFFLKIYPLIKEIVLMKKTDSRFKNKSFRYQIKPENFYVDVTFETDSSLDFPKKITIQNSKYFLFEIENTEYQTLKPETNHH